MGRLRPATVDDLDDLMHLLHKEGVRRYLCDDTVLPRETVAGMLVRSEELDPRGLGLWAIERPDDNFAGIAGLEPVSEETGAASGMGGGIEPIIALKPEHWGRGIAGQALGALIDYARGPLELPGLVAAVDQPNAQSHALMKRCGFAVTGRAPGPANELVLYELRLDCHSGGELKAPFGPT